MSETSTNNSNKKVVKNSQSKQTDNTQVDSVIKKLKEKTE